MPTVVQFRRGSQTQNNNFLGASGELSVNTTSNSVRVHDGTQTGGYELARADLSNVSTGILTSLSIGTGAASTEVISEDRSLNNILAINSQTKETLAQSLLSDNTLNIDTGNINAGVITATSRLDVGTGLVAYPHASGTDVNVTGILTASSFEGSGINLSGIVTSILAGSGIQILTSNSGIVTVTATGTSGGGGLTEIQVQNEGAIVGSAGTFNFRDDFLVDNPTAAGVATVSLSSTKAFNILGAIPVTSGQGFIGTITSNKSFGNGHFSHFTVDNLLTVSGVLNVRDAIDLADSDILRFGDSDDASISYDGSANRLGLTLANSATDFAIKNGSNAFAVFNRSDGRLGIGIESPTEALDVVGNIKASQTISAQDFNTTSDVNLKTDIETITDALSIISSIRGVRFSWKEDKKPSLGVIAQEIEDVIPELVTDGDPKKVNYNGLIGVLLQSVKELNDEVNNLKNENKIINDKLNYILDKLS